MAEDEERRKGTVRSNRRDPARNMRRDPPVIEGMAQEVTHTAPAEPLPAAGVTPVEASAPSTAFESAVEPVAPAPSESVAPEGVVPPEISPDTTPPEPRPETAAQAEPSAAPQEPARSTFATLAALGFLLLAAGLLYAFYLLSSLPADNSAVVADLRSRLAAVESRPGSDTTDLDARLTKLQSATGEVQTGLAALGKRVDELAGTLSAQPNPGAQIADLQSGLAGLKTSLAAVQTSVAEIPRPDIGKIESRVGDLDQRLAALQISVGNIPHVDLGPLTGKVDDLQARLKPIEAEVGAASAPDAVAQRKAAPMAVTAQAIFGAIQAGQAFPRELHALQALGADPARVAPLQAVADSGAPSLGDLRATLGELRDRIVAQGTAPASGSYVDRLVAGASNLVQVRPLGSVVGDTPSAIVARMDAALGSDELATALAEWKKLPDASQSVSKALADRIRLRLDAETAAKEIANNAIGAMAGPKG